MADDSSEDRTEDPTSKKQEEAKEKGQVARSKELSSASVLLVAVCFALMAGHLFTDPVIDVAKANFGFSQGDIFDPAMMVKLLTSSLIDVGMSFVGLIFAISFAAVFAAIIVGGWNFSLQSLQPKCPI